MSIDYPVVGIVILALAVLIYFIVRRNIKDEKQLEKELNQPDLRTGVHTEDSEVETEN